jgi:recombination protein RecR
MSYPDYPSKWLEIAIKEFSKLPGIGAKTAFRLLMHILRQNKEQIIILSNSLKDLAENIKYCKICCSISDNNVCNICSNTSRDTSIICVVEDVNDLFAIERTKQYNGLYHVLNGLISPIEGISPSQLTISVLEDRIKKENIQEIIFALSATVEADTTAYYIYKKLYAINNNIKFTTIAKGISVGNELEYTDELTLARSIKNRLIFS